MIPAVPPPYVIYSAIESSIDYMLGSLRPEDVAGSFACSGWGCSFSKRKSDLITGEQELVVDTLLENGDSVLRYILGFSSLLFLILKFDLEGLCPLPFRCARNTCL